MNRKVIEIYLKAQLLIALALKPLTKLLLASLLPKSNLPLVFVLQLLLI